MNKYKKPRQTKNISVMNRDKLKLKVFSFNDEVQRQPDLDW